MGSKVMIYWSLLFLRYSCFICSRQIDIYSATASVGFCFIDLKIDLMHAGKS